MFNYLASIGMGNLNDSISIKKLEKKIEEGTISYDKLVDLLALYLHSKEKHIKIYPLCRKILKEDPTKREPIIIHIKARIAYKEYSELLEDITYYFNEGIVDGELYHTQLAVAYNGLGDKEKSNHHWELAKSKK